MKAAEKYDIETLIDRYGLTKILETVAEVCAKKAKHVRRTWQDHDLAMAWEDAASALDKAVSIVLDLNLDGR